MKKQRSCSGPYCLLMIVIILSCIPITHAKDFVNINSSMNYSVHNRVHVTNTYGSISKIIIILPLPQSNTYQDVIDLNIDSGDVLDIPETDDRYLRFVITEDLPVFGESRTYGYDFTITLHNITIDLDVPEILYDYDTNTSLYQWYTGSSGNIVDPDNPDILAIADPIWDGSPNVVYFAERCYEYVAENFEYLNPGVGLSPLSTVMANGGGDCGNLSSIFVSLLRCKGIPARHVVTMRPDGSHHVWAEFYLEKYGWVPVDVTYKMDRPDRNYFGYYDGNGIVFNSEVALQIDRGDGTIYDCPLLQTFLLWYWGNGGGSLNFTHDLKGILTFVDNGTLNPEHTVLYPAFPNPFNPSTTISYNLNRDNFVSLDIFNTLGKRVGSIVNSYQSADLYQLRWEPSDLPGGAYLIQLKAGDVIESQKVILIK